MFIKLRKQFQWHPLALQNRGLEEILSPVTTTPTTSAVKKTLTLATPTESPGEESSSNSTSVDSECGPFCGKYHFDFVLNVYIKMFNILIFAFFLNWSDLFLQFSSFNKCDLASFCDRIYCRCCSHMHNRKLHALFANQMLQKNRSSVVMGYIVR